MKMKWKFMNTSLLFWLENTSSAISKTHVHEHATPLCTNIHTLEVYNARDHVPDTKAWKNRNSSNSKKNDTAVFLANHCISVPSSQKDRRKINALNILPSKKYEVREAIWHTVGGGFSLRAVI